MEISQQTIDILKNFSNINQSLMITEEKTIVTMSASNNIIGVYDTEEIFPKFGIWDLPELLSSISLFTLSETDFLFKEKYLLMKYKSNTLKYIFTDIDLIPLYGIIKPSEKYKNFNKFDAHFELSKNDINRLKKSAAILFTNKEGFGSPNINVLLKNGEGEISLSNNDNSTGNKFKIKINDAEGDCNISVNINNLILLAGDYKISVLSKKLIKFQHNDLPLFYFVTSMVT